MGPTVRRAGHADAAAMTRLVRAAYAVYVPRIGGEPAPMKDDYAVVARDEEAWLAEEDERLVGLVVLHAHDDHLLLENIAVTPDAQRRGVGRMLLKLADRRARELGLPEVRLYTNIAMTENLAYYPRHGYRETHRGTQDGYQRVFFTKRLSG